MWEQQSSIRIWAGTRLHPDLGAARLGQDLNVGKYQNGTSYTRVSARHNRDARAPL